MASDPSIRKRSQINKAGRNMFVTVAIASAVVSVSIVVAVILMQRILFLNHVIGEKNNTLKTLEDNNRKITSLKNNIQALNSNQALLDSRIKNSNEEALQVVLDALPSEANSLALGSSLQNVLLNLPSTSISVESLTVDPVSGVESNADASGSTVYSAAGTSAQTISFTFSVSGTLPDLITVLQRLEKSIRPITTTTVKFEFQHDNILLMTVRGLSYYQPEKVVQLQTKVVKQ